jgi:outer membrane protein insertion porin family
LWKLKRLDEKRVDLELVVKEGKTGHAGFSITYGGDTKSLKSPLKGLNFKGELSDSNLFGHGINAILNLTLSREEQGLLFHVAQPWLFDKPIFGAFDLYHKRPSYILFHHIERGSVNEKVTGGLGTLGYMVQTTHPWFVRLSFLAACGIENIAYNHPPQSAFFQDQSTTEQYQFILDREFTPGTYAFLTFSIDQDLRNHPIHTSRGHKLKINTRIGISPHDKIGFCKFDTDFVWYTPLIGETDLVFKFRGYAGFVTSLQNKNIPFGELYLLGGQNSIRGFEFGQAGPQFQDDPIGGKKGIFVSADLIFPIMSDLSMKAVLFYNGGAGFDNPYAQFVSKDNIRNNNFDYRHAVGFGIRLLKPTAISIDWGFKIDPRKNRGNPRLSETAHEVHFVMGYDF